MGRLFLAKTHLISLCNNAQFSKKYFMLVATQSTLYNLEYTDSQTF
jgi:hypothetical protein